MTNNFWNKLAYPLLTHLPLLVVLFFCLYPMWIGVALSNPFGAISSVFIPYRKVTCDLYLTLFYCTIVTYVYHYVKYLLPRIVIITMFMVMLGVRLFLKYYFDMSITQTAVGLFMETTANEAWGFIKQYLLDYKGLVYVACLLSLSYIAFFIDNKWNNYVKLCVVNKNLRCAVSMLLVVMLIVGVLSQKQYIYLDNDTNTITAVNLAIRNYNVNKALSEDFYKKMASVADDSCKVSASIDTCNIILIIGESFIKSHAEIYGYPLATTPNMHKGLVAGNLISFSDVISPYNYTTPSMREILYVGNGGHWAERLFLPQLFKKAGYNVTVLDNQKGEDAKSNSSCAEMYSRRTESLCYDYLNEKSNYNDDAFVVELLKTRLQQTNRVLL